MFAGYIDGAFVAGEGSDLILEIPPDGTEIVRLKGLFVAQFENAALAARAAFDKGDWSRCSMSKGAALLHRFLDHMEAHGEKIITMIIAETGCPISSKTLAAQFATPLRMGREIIDLWSARPRPRPISCRDPRRATIWARASGAGAATRPSAWSWAYRPIISRSTPACGS